MSRSRRQVTVGGDGFVTGAVAAIETLGFEPGTGLATEMSTDTLTLEAGGRLDGDALLYAGDDTFNDASGQFTNVFGGDGVDTVNFSGGARVLNGSGAAGDSLQGFEVFNFSSEGLDLAGDHTGLTEVNFLSGTNRLSGSLEAPDVTVFAGAVLNAGDGSFITGNLVNNGVLDVGDSPGTFRLDGSLTLGATSVLPMEIDALSSDLIIVSGATELGGVLDIQILDGLGFGTATRTLIQSGTALSGEFEEVLFEGRAPGILFGVEAVSNPDTLTQDLVTNLTRPSDIASLTDEQAVIGDTLGSMFGDNQVAEGLRETIFDIFAVDDEATLSIVLDELGPDGLVPGVRLVTQTQNQFADIVLDHALDQAASHAWTAANGFAIEQDGNGNLSNFDGDATTLAFGVSNIAVGPFAVSAALGHSRLLGRQEKLLGDKSETDLFHVGGAISKDLSFGKMNARLDTLLAYATGDTQVAVNTADIATGTQVQQTSKFNISGADLVTQATLIGWNQEALSVRPQIKLGLNTIQHNQARLQTGNDADIFVAKREQSRGFAEFGMLFDQGLTERLSFSGRLAGVQYFGDTETAFVSRFVGAAPDAQAFRTLGDSVEQQFEVEAYLSFTVLQAFEVSAGGFAEAGDLEAQGARVTLNKAF